MEANSVGPPPSTFSAHSDATEVHCTTDLGTSISRPTSETAVVADGHSVDVSNQQVVHVQQQDIQVSLTSSGTGQPEQQSNDVHQHCSIAWLTSDQNQSVTGPLPPVSEVVNSQRSSRVAAQIGSNSMQSQDNLQSYLTCSLPEDVGHSGTLELISGVTSIDRIQLTSDHRTSNIYSVAPSCGSGGHALTSDTSAHHLDKQSHYHADSLVHHLEVNLAHQTTSGSSLPNFSEVSGGRESSANLANDVQVQQRFYDDQSMVAGVEDTPTSSQVGIIDKDFEGFVETLPCYKCKLCSYISLSRDGAEQHVRLNHSKELLGPEKMDTKSVPVEAEKPSSEHTILQKYICGICAKAFTDIESCSVHMNYAHNLSAESVHLEPVTASEQLLHNIQQQEQQLQQESSAIISAQQGQECQMAEVGDVKQTTVQVASDGGQSEATPKTTAKKRKRKKSNNGNKPVVTSETDKAAKDGTTCELAVTASLAEVKGANNAVGIADNDNGQQRLANEVSADAPKSRKRGPRMANKNVSPSNDQVVASTKVEGTLEDESATGQRCEATGCSVWLRSTENLEYHKKCHADTGFECVECLEHFDRWKTLCVHLWREHLIDMELYACDLCNYKTYSYSKLMNLHRRIHSDERPYLCDVCGKGFKTSKQLRNHKVIHLERKPQRNLRSGECDVCHRYFSDKRMLRVHKDTVHNKLRPYMCNYCGYAASCRSTLKMHVRQHTGEKPFACDACDYRTADHNSLRRHKMRHSGEKPYKCPFCTYACIQSSTYKAHLKNKHPGMDAGLMFCCDQCTFKTIKKENFVAHMADHAAAVAENDGGKSTIEFPSSLLSVDSAQSVPVQVVLTTTTQPRPIDLPKGEERGQVEDAGSSIVQASATTQEHFIFPGLDDVQHDNIHQQVYKLEGNDPEERFPILAGQLKLGQSPPSCEASLSPEEQQAVLLQHHQLAIDRSLDSGDNTTTVHVIHLVHQEDSNDADDNMSNVHHTQVGNDRRTADCVGDLKHPRNVAEEQPEEVLSHAQLTPVPPSEVSAENGPMLW